MFLRQLRLTNIRCFADLSLDFGHDGGEVRKWTILLGENGTGKSTILRAAALVTAGSDALPPLLNDPAPWLRLGARRGLIEATLQTKEGEQRAIHLEIKSGDSESDVIARAKETLEPLEAALNHAARNYFVAGYGVSRRLASESTRARPKYFRHPRAQSVATLFDSEASLNPLESWAMDIDYRRKDGIETVRKVLSDFLPGLSFHAIDKNAGALLFKTPDGILPLHQLSDGYQNVAAWVGDLLFSITDRFEDYQNPLHTRGLLIVDEVGLHLHPKWQRSLHSFLQKHLPNMQLLVTTHSALLAQQAQAQEIHYLKRHGKTVSIHRFEPDPSRLLVNQLLTTDAFGLNTDESLDVETKKNQYRRLRDKKSRSARDKKRLQELGAELRSAAKGEAGMADFHAEQVALLKRVQDELGKKR